MGVRDEIGEQPQVAGRLLDLGRAVTAEAARAIRAADVQHVVIAARGSSDHAATYAQYVFGVRHNLTVALATPSVLTAYGAEPRMSQALVIGISQSGVSPDVIAVVDAGRRQGAVTLAITNDPDSPLARAADLLISLHAGDEQAVAATKTYTAELVAIAMLSAALREEPDDDLSRLPKLLADAIDAEPTAADAAAHLAPMRACLVLGRGYEYATVREWALKLKELARVMADPYSWADFQHGPITLVGPGVRVLLVASSGALGDELKNLTRRLTRDLGAETVVIGDDPAILRQARFAIERPAGIPDHLAPILSIVPAQLFAFHLAQASGLDPDRPRYLSKVTLTH